MATWTYLTEDLRTGNILAELPLTGVSFDRQLNKPGNLSGSFFYTSKLELQRGIREGTVPLRTGLYAFRDGVPIWGGIIMKRDYNRDSRTVSLSCEGFETYLYARKQSITRYFADTDQLDIARWLIAQADATPVGDIRIQVSTALSGVIRDRTFLAYEGKTLGEELDQLSALENGFDFNVNVYLDANVLYKRYDFGTPELGAPKDTTDLMFEYPGNIKSFSVSEDGSKAATTVYAVGAGEADYQLIETASSTDQLDNGWPLYEAVVPYKDVVRPSTLHAHAQADLRARIPPVTTFNVGVRGGLDPELSRYRPGDWARFRFDDPWFNGVYDAKYRIMAVNASISDEGEESAALSIGSGNEDG